MTFQALLRLSFLGWLALGTAQAEPPMVGVLQETKVMQKPYVDEAGQSKTSIAVGSEHFHELRPAGARAVVLELAWDRVEPQRSSGF